MVYSTVPPSARQAKYDVVACAVSCDEYSFSAENRGWYEEVTDKHNLAVVWLYRWHRCCCSIIVKNY